MGYDKRIGQSFLSPGPGWGGSCLPKDTQALLQAADSADFEFRLVRAAIETNTRQYQRMVEKVRLAVTGSRTGSLSRRTTDQADGRRIRLALSNRGRARLALVQDFRRERFAAAMTVWTETERTVFADLLTRFVDRLNTSE